VESIYEEKPNEEGQIEPKLNPKCFCPLHAKPKNRRRDYKSAAILAATETSRDKLGSLVRQNSSTLHLATSQEAWSAASAASASTGTGTGTGAIVDATEFQFGESSPRESGSGSGSGSGSLTHIHVHVALRPPARSNAMEGFVHSNLANVTAGRRENPLVG
jgi:hypothetical protein